MTDGTDLPNIAPVRGPGRAQLVRKSCGDVSSRKTVKFLEIVKLPKSLKAVRTGTR